MFYPYYQAYERLSDPVRAINGALNDGLVDVRRDAAQGNALGAASATCELIALMGLTHARPKFDLQPVRLRGRDFAVRQETVSAGPFASLLRFSLDGLSGRPRVLLIAPLAGHFATLLRGTVRTLLADHEVFLTDWHNARDIAPASGRFGLDEYVSHLVRFLELAGPGAHVVAVCQSVVAALASVALMAEDDHPAQPRTLTLMAGPIDTRIHPTRINQFATGRSIEWFAQAMTDTVPAPFAGAGRRVHPGFLQLGASMSMDVAHHVEAFAGLYRDRVLGEHARADATKRHYQEYFATMDLPAEFYLDTVSKVFQQHALPRGEFDVGGRRVDAKAIRRTALLTIEGQDDRVCPPGQTHAAHELCSSLRPSARKRHVQPGASHYDVFSGPRWETDVYPLVRETTHQFAG